MPSDDVSSGQIILALIGLLGLVLPSALTAWVAIKVRRIEPKVNEMLPLVKATDNAINGEGPEEATAGETIRSSGAALARLEAQGRVDRGEDPAG